MHSIEIVTHCWKYSRALAWQIASLEKYRQHTAGPDVLLTVVTSIHDRDTKALVDKSPCNVLYLGHPQLFNRAIGRNMVARNTEADWVWFCDADYFFGPNCLRELAALDPAEHTLCYPGQVRVTRTHQIGDQYLAAGPAVGVAPGDWRWKGQGKAIGGCQIVPGRIAREIGYCDWPKMQRPVEGDSMADTRSDRAFRVSLGTSGTAIDLSDVYRIRHSTSGLDRPVGGREKWVGN